MGERVAAETLYSDERVERRGSLCVGSGKEEIYKRVGLLAVRRGKIGERCQSNNPGPGRELVRLQLTRMSTRYISRDVCQPTVFYVILDIRLSFLQDLSKIIKSDKRPGKDYLIVDVRDSDFIGGHIPNCRNEPSTTFLDRLD